MTVTTDRPGRLRTRVAVAVVVVVLGVIALAAMLVVPMLRPPGPRPPFQLPVGCGETWQLGTYPGHDDYDIDLFPHRGEAWGQPVLASYGGTSSRRASTGHWAAVRPTTRRARAEPAAVTG